MLTNRIDSLGAALLPIAYLIATVGATGYYFTNGHNVGFLGLIVIGQIMAFATEVHSYLVQRRVRIAYRLMQQGKEHDFWVQLGTLTFLVGFQCFTGIAFAVATWQAPLAAQIARGCAIPLFFLLASLLTRIDLDVSDMIQRHHFQMTLHTVRAATRQHDKRLRALMQGEANLTPVSVALMRHVGDEHGATGMEAIDRALALVEGHDTLSAIVSSPEDDEPREPRRIAPPQEDQEASLSEPALKRQIRRMLEEDITRNPRDLENLTGAAYSTCYKYYHQLLDEWGMEEVPRPRRRTA